MEYEELNKKASLGDDNALEELIGYAEQGEADAQFLLSCLYEQDGPLKNEEQADYWLDMAVYNGHEQAKQKYHEKPLKPIKNFFAEDESLASADSPQSNSDFNGSAVTDENPIVSGSNDEETPPKSYTAQIIGIVISIGLIIAGLSGEFVLRGTNSSIALVLAGAGFLIYDIWKLTNGT